MEVKDIIKKINEIEMYDIDTYAKEWIKGDFHRIYVNQSWHVKGGREVRNYTLGYIDVKENKFVEQGKGYAYSSRATQETINQIEEFLK